MPFLDSLSSIRSIKRSRKASTGTHLEVILDLILDLCAPTLTYASLTDLDGLLEPLAYLSGSAFAPSVDCVHLTQFASNQTRLSRNLDFHNLQGPGRLPMRSLEIS